MSTDATDQTDIEVGTDTAAPQNTDAAQPQQTPLGEAAPPPTDTGAQEQESGRDQGAWGSDWRDQIAESLKLNKKERARLDRWSDPAQMFNSTRELEQRISSGDLRSDLPEDPTEEQMAEYRQQRGIPDEPSGYFDALEGVTIGDDDKPIFEGAFEFAHKNNLSAKQMQGMVEWYMNEADERLKVVQQEDARLATQFQEDAREVWGNDYHPNLNAIEAFMSSADPELAAAVKGGRMADGTPLFANIDFMNFLLAKQTQINPVATALPQGTSNTVESLERRRAELEELQRTDRPAYNRRADEYLSILKALERHQS